MSTVIDTAWFTSGNGLVGIVKVETDLHEIEYFIAPCDGFNEIIDKNLVAARGAKFPVSAGEALFGDKNV